MSRPPEPLKVQPVYTQQVSTIGARMRAAREAAKLSQLDVAAELGVTKGSLSAWENDKNFPQLQTFIQLCQLYGTSADALLFSATAVAEPRAQYKVGEAAVLQRLVDGLSDEQQRALVVLLAK
ncbi:hypothetical protein XnspCFBP7698_00900 [Xanthomonas sp. CFBP 7698]|nr:hypothetical protein XnspCFBP7698_00900 [Xanthomonas sp. CFBP 7698]